MTAIDPRGLTLQIGLPGDWPARARELRQAAPPPRIELGFLPEAEVVSTVHEGPYADLYGAHEELEAWLREHRRSEIGARWERCLVGPLDGEDPARFLTQIFVPIG